MSKSEDTFLAEVQKVLDHSDTHKKTAIKLMGIEEPDTKDFSLNAQELADWIYELKFSYEDGELELVGAGFTDEEDEEMHEKERQLINQTISKVTSILSDIKSGNKYQSVYFLDFAYSKLDGGDYLYKMVNKRIEANTLEDAKRIRDAEKLKAPKHHPDDTSYSLEDIRINVEIVDSKGKVVEPQKYIFN